MLKDSIFFHLNYSLTVSFYLLLLFSAFIIYKKIKSFESIIMASGFLVCLFIVILKYIAFSAKHESIFQSKAVMMTLTYTGYVYLFAMVMGALGTLLSVKKLLNQSQ